MNLDQIKNETLVFDIETSDKYPDGRYINIRTNFEDYVYYARCKWFGAYSYKHNKEYYLNVYEDGEKIYDLLREHKNLVGFNSEEFDYPILQNDGFIEEKAKYLLCRQNIMAPGLGQKFNFVIM